MPASLFTNGSSTDGSSTNGSSTDGLPTLSVAQQQVLLACAYDSIAAALNGQADMPPQKIDAVFEQPGAVFVTLETHGHLRGCIGSLQAHRSLYRDVWFNAQAAALRDPRFPPLQHDELAALQISLSLIGAAQALAVNSESELLAALVPHQHGVIIEDHGHRATFLPQVWAHFSRPGDFLMALRNKAGLPATFNMTQRYFCYQTLSIKKAR